MLIVCSWARGMRRMKEGRRMAGGKLDLGRYLRTLRRGKGDWLMLRCRTLLPNDGA